MTASLFVAIICVDALFQKAAVRDGFKDKNQVLLLLLLKNGSKLCMH